MRKWHRWLSVFFAVFMFWIAATGLLSQWAALWPEDGAIITEANAHGEERHDASQAAGSMAAMSGEGMAAGTAPTFTCPEGWRCRPARPATGPRAWTGFFHDLHSGEEFGPIGLAISILSGFALMFFAGSGLWMYIRMWRERARRGAKDRWFWK